MAGRAKVLVAAAVLVVPGGLVMLLGFVLSHAVWEAFQAVRRERPGKIELRAVWEATRFRDSWQRTRAWL